MLNEDALRDVNAQALFTLSYLAPTDTTNQATDIDGLTKNIGFYRFGMEAELELNANIKSLQLGCGGINGTGGCDIDIKNLSLSGLNDGTDTSDEKKGSPTFSDHRASTSAKITNPFMELAIKNPQSASTREVVGFRLSAEAIEGLLSAGLTNGSTPTSDDGIQSLSGYMQIASTTGHVYTEQTKFGLGTSDCLPRSDGCQAIGGKLSALFGASNKYFRSVPNSTESINQGITVPSLKVDFSLPAFTVNGNRQTQAVAPNVTARIPWLPIAAAGSCPTGTYYDACMTANAQISNVDFSQDGIFVRLTTNNDDTNWGNSCILGLVCTAKFKMANGSAIQDLDLNITFNESLSMIHNIPLRGTGGYLSLQGQALRWPGANSDDVAQKGWWMSFAEPVQLGYLQAQNKVNVESVLPQVAKFATNSLLAGDRIDAGSFSDTWNALWNNPLQKHLVIGVSGEKAYMSLANQQLTNQHLATNCYGSLKFC